MKFSQEILKFSNEIGKWSGNNDIRFGRKEKRCCGTVKLTYLDKNKEYQGVKNLVIYSTRGDWLIVN